MLPLYVIGVHLNRYTHIYISFYYSSYTVVGVHTHLSLTSLARIFVVSICGSQVVHKYYLPLHSIFNDSSIGRYVMMEDVTRVGVRGPSTPKLVTRVLPSDPYDDRIYCNQCSGAMRAWLSCLMCNVHMEEDKSLSSMVSTIKDPLPWAAVRQLS